MVTTTALTDRTEEWKTSSDEVHIHVTYTHTNVASAYWNLS